MALEKIISDWQKGSFKPIYLLEGDEPYYIDQIVNYAEKKLLTESEAGFNLTIFYGRDASWTDVTNACKRFPMFAERQVVLLKEAQSMRDIAKLESYCEKPQPSTVLIISHKEKKLDARSKLSKIIKKNGEIATFKKIQDYKLPEWITTRIRELGYEATPKTVMLLADHIGTDLSRIDNELNKLAVNLKDRKTITEDDIETYIGISKDYNVFELQRAVASKNLPRAISIIQYFAKNPKAAPVQVILPTLYGFFAKTAMVFNAGNSESAVASALGVAPFFAKDYLAAARLYGSGGVDKTLLLLHSFNLKGIGINNGGASESDLLKELVTKIIL